MCLNNSYQTVCGISVDYYRKAGPRAGVSWCVRARAEILRAIVANQCLPPHVNHPNFEGRFIPHLRIACNMVHGQDFASVIGPHFDRLVKHYAKRWVVANGIVLEDESVPGGFRFNHELVEKCFNNVGAIERWLRDDMGKLDWWEKVARDPGLIPPPPPPSIPYPSTAAATPSHPTPTTPTTPTTPVTQSRRRMGTATSPAAGKWRSPPQTPTHHKGGPGSAQIDCLVSGLETLGFPSDPSVSPTPSTPTRCPPGPPSGLFSDPASGLAGENLGQMAAASVSPVPAEDATPVLGPELWGPGSTPTAVVPNLLEPSRVMFPPTPAPSLASAKAPSTVPPSPERSVFPSSSSSSSSPTPRHPPAPSTIASSCRARSVAGAAPSTFFSLVTRLSSIPSSPPSRFQQSPRPPPPPTTILTEGATDAPLVVEAPAMEHTHDGDGSGDGFSGGDGGNSIGIENGVDNWEDRIRESLESTRRAWRYVVEVETAAQVVMFGMDRTI